MTIDDLIKEGEEAKVKCLKGNIISGEDYEKWIAKSILFMEKKYPNQTLTKKFIETAKNANGNFNNCYDIMMGILKAYKEMENV